MKKEMGETLLTKCSPADFKFCIFKTPHLLNQQKIVYTKRIFLTGNVSRLIYQT